MTKDEALKLALEALKEAQTNDDGMEKWDRNKKAIAALEEVLAQPEQEPLAYGMWDTMAGKDRLMMVRLDKGQDGCTVPLGLVQREWVGLTDEDIGQWIEEEHDVLRWAEAKLKEKNT